ncbi:arginyl-tRNA synthetase [Crocosphaera chwakensis]|uniref:Arginyl tRNA synthetase anticodon binding protein n=1 Tax=Crocosphaera chwakensis CCY0110 TaxID=391612 RepID=A3IKS5_9CHRO|nr:arginyl-tRNA synthetase [Crocosphaera chwakensis]EAZ92794.1 Arginyl tRNA synthetase anticodon binding protein [Crocosphaera chwakensis CCY0110]
MTKNRIIKNIYPLTIKITNLSIQQQLQQFLITQLLKLDNSNFTNFLSNNNPISIYRLPKIDSISYRCAIAFQLSSYSPLTLAETIFNTLQQQPNHSGALSFTVTLLDPGWLEFTLCDRRLSLWLQSWQSFAYPRKRFTLKSRNHDNLCPLEYTYARCCTLLRLGDKEGLIKLEKEIFEPYQWPLSTSQPIPWSSLVLNQFERSLISQIITTVDRLENKSNRDEIKLGLALSETFLSFERYCRIFGKISGHNSHLSQARLGLVAITQLLLQGLWLSHMEQLPRDRL